MDYLSGHLQHLVKKDSFDNTMTYSEFKNLLPPPVNLDFPWGIDEKYRITTFLPHVTMPSNAENPVICNTKCRYNDKIITEESFNRLSDEINKLDTYNLNVVIPKDYSDLSDWKAIKSSPF